VEVNGDAEKEVAPLCVCAVHCHLYVLTGLDQIGFPDSYTFWKQWRFSKPIPYNCVDFFNSTNPSLGKASGLLTQPSGVAASHG